MFIKASNNTFFILTLVHTWYEKLNPPRIVIYTNKSRGCSCLELESPTTFLSTLWILNDVISKGLGIVWF